MKRSEKKKENMKNRKRRFSIKKVIYRKSRALFRFKTSKNSLAYTKNVFHVHIESMCSKV